MAYNKKILVVEDNDFVRMQIVRYLQEAEFDVFEASDGREALEAMTDKVGLAIVDVRMEPIDGFAFLKTLRSNDNTTPVVLVTGDQNPDLLNEAHKWGVAAVLMKPVQKDRLIKMATRAMRDRKH